MVIYSDILTTLNLQDACPADIECDPGALTGSRARRFEGVRLFCPFARKVNKRHPNTGTHGADRAHRCATWDEHGQWMAALFAIDPAAKIKGYATYDGVADFHAQTAYRYGA